MGWCWVALVVCISWRGGRAFAIHELYFVCVHVCMPCIAPTLPGSGPTNIVKNSGVVWCGVAAFLNTQVLKPQKLLSNNQVPDYRGGSH